MNNANQVDILGIKVDGLSVKQAITEIIERPEQTSAVYITKPYVEFFMQPRYQQLINGAWLVLPDGVALQWAAYYQTTSGSLWQLCKTLSHIVFAPEKIRHPIPDKFAGTNFTFPLLEAAAQAGRSVYLVGSPRDGDITHTKEVIESRIPDINIIGMMPGRDESGVFSEHMTHELTEELQRKQPDITLLGLGFPRQEIVMKQIAPELEYGILIGEGGTFDYDVFGGHFKKAPKIVQRIGLEWLWRLILEPSRIRRQLAIPKFIWRMYRFTNTTQNKYHT